MGKKHLVESRRCPSFLPGDNSKLRNRKGNPTETVTEFRMASKEPEIPERRSEEEGATRWGELPEKSA